jgi:hypothetical protein
VRKVQPGPSAPPTADPAQHRSGQVDPTKKNLKPVYSILAVLLQY